MTEPRWRGACPTAGVAATRRELARAGPPCRRAEQAARRASTAPWPTSAPSSPPRAAATATHARARPFAAYDTRATDPRDALGRRVRRHWVRQEVWGFDEDLIARRRRRAGRDERRRIARRKRASSRGAEATRPTTPSSRRRAPTATQPAPTAATPSRARRVAPRATAPPGARLARRSARAAATRWASVSPRSAPRRAGSRARPASVARRRAVSLLAACCGPMTGTVRLHGGRRVQQTVIVPAMPRFARRRDLEVVALRAGGPRRVTPSLVLVHGAVRANEHWLRAIRCRSARGRTLRRSSIGNTVAHRGR